MSRADPVVAAVELGELATRYPRTVGRNARLGSHGAGPAARIAVLRTDDGRAGWGLVEGDAAADSVVGRPLSELVGSGGLRDGVPAALDPALHDLLGVVEDRPVAALLGGGPGPVEVYDAAIYFDDLDPDGAGTAAGVAAIVEECRADAALGHTAFKLKIGRGHRWMDRTEGDRRDVEVTRAVRDAFPDARLLVDANDGYDLEGMLRYVDAVADVGLYWIEEPFPDDRDDLLALRAHLDAASPGTRIADGESDPDVESLLGIATDGGVQVLLMDACSYGISRWRAIAGRVRGAGAEASPHAWGQPLKTLYAAHLARGLGRVPMVEGVIGRVEGVDPEAMRVDDGVLAVGDRPGFGLPVPTAERIHPIA